jgi:hypothetical protein
MKLINIIKIIHLKDYILEITFDDYCSKQFDFEQLIDFKGISKSLQNIEYFKTVKILDEGRAFGWDNGYDCCADWARYYAKDKNDEWKDIDENVDLKQRMKIAKQKFELETI